VVLLGRWLLLGAPDVLPMEVRQRSRRKDLLPLMFLDIRRAVVGSELLLLLREQQLKLLLLLVLLLLLQQMTLLLL
jgi:hypothetical protein